MPKDWIDEYWPSGARRVGLKFADARSFERARLLIWDEIYRYFETNPEELFVVVLEDDQPRFTAAGLQYEEFEIPDLEAMPPEEAAALDRRAIEYWKPIILERLRQRG